LVKAPVQLGYDVAMSSYFIFYTCKQRSFIDVAICQLDHILTKLLFIRRIIALIVEKYEDKAQDTLSRPSKTDVINSTERTGRKKCVNMMSWQTRQQGVWSGGTVWEGDCMGV